MVGHIRDEDEHQIYSDMARRIGVLIKQYSDLSQSLQEEERYGATLALCLLHPLLVNYEESSKRYPKKIFEDFKKPLLHIPDIYGINRSVIKEFTFYDKFHGIDDVTFDFSLEMIRDALSHPCPVSMEGFPRTGYETIKGGGNNIERILFFNSPDVQGNSGRLIGLSEKGAQDLFDSIAKRGNAENFKIVRAPGTGARNFHIAYSNGERLIRKFVLEVPADSLGKLILGLSDFLSETVGQLLTQVPANQSRRMTGPR